MLVRKRRQTGLSVSNLALLLMVFKWYHGSELVTLFYMFGSCFRMLAVILDSDFFNFFFCANSDWRNLKCGHKALQVNGCTSMVTVLHHIELGFPEHTLTLRHQRDFAPIITYRAWYAQIWFLAGEPLIKYINTAKYLELELSRTCSGKLTFIVIITIPLFGHTKILRTLTGKGRAVLAAAVPYPGKVTRISHKGTMKY